MGCYAYPFHFSLQQELPGLTKTFDMSLPGYNIAVVSSRIATMIAGLSAILE